jgi:uncharacterized protein (DUF433 family)
LADRVHAGERIAEIDAENKQEGCALTKGTRLSVEFILGLYAEGWTEDQILENYPNLTKESLLAVFSYTRE